MPPSGGALSQVLGYQSLLPGELLVRGVKELEEELVGNQFETALLNYVSRADHVEGKFVNTNVETESEQLSAALSALSSALGQYKNKTIDRARAIDIGNRAVAAQQAYRKAVRIELGI